MATDWVGGFAGSWVGSLDVDHYGGIGLNPEVERVFRGTLARWRWLLFVRWIGWTVLGACLGVVGLGAMALLGGVTDVGVAALGVAAVVLFVGIALVIGGIRAASAAREEAWLAERIEGAAPALLDRLNTLADLERRGSGREWVPAIGEQAAGELARAGRIRAVSAEPTWMVVVAASIALAGTVFFLTETRPWDELGRESVAVVGAAEDAFELDLPDDTSSQMRAAWGEVRITEPGGDLKLTKVDVLPITVEAASNEALRRASWTTAVNGGAARDRVLPEPREPNYAVYEPLLYLDELAVDDWDVVSYSASALAGEATRYSSEIFFVEIRPFREELIKLEGGGGGGAAMACLKKLSRLIEKQTDILRGTHRQEGRPAETSEEREQDQAKLVGAQGETRDATAHLYGEVAEIEHEDIATVLDQLAQARDTMDGAVGALETSDNGSALAAEQLALQQLVESRKDYLKALANGAGGGSGGAEESQPVAGMDLDGRIADMAEFRDARAAAMTAVREAREAQEALAEEAAATDKADLPGLELEQKRIAATLEAMRERAPEPFQAAEAAAGQATSAMGVAADSLAGGDRQAAGDARAAAEKLAELEAALARQDALEAMADVYRMKAVLDAQAERLAESGGDATEAERNEELAQAGDRIERAKAVMEETLEDTGAGELFGPGLGRSLAGEPGERLDAAAKKLQEGGGEGATEAMAALEEIATSFEASQPGSLRGAGADRLAGPGEVSDAARILGALAKRMAERRELSDEDLRRQLEEARLALVDARETAAVPKLAALAADLEAMSGDVDLEIDEVALRKLVDRLESYRLEMADLEREMPVDPALLKFDPAEAPEEFRDRVRRYFEKLSEGA